MLALLSPRRKAKPADQPPPSPPFFHLTALSSPTPAPHLRRPAGGAARIASPVLLVRYFWLLLPRHLVSFCCGAVAAAVFLSATPQDGGGHTGAAGSCGQQLLRATSATRSALTACHTAAAPAARASALLALDAASRVPARVYLAAVLLFALCTTLVAAWRAVSGFARRAQRSLAVRGTRAQKWLARRSAAAAAASPVLLLVTVFLLLPQRVRSALTAPPLLVLIALGIPSIASFAALRSGAALPSSEACLSYWCALTPLLAAHGTPLVGAMLRSAVLASPAWRAAAVLACLALQWPTTGCASAACAALEPSLAPLAGRTGARAGTLAVLLQGLWARVAPPGWLSGSQDAASSSGMASLTTALGATTPALLLCTLCLLGAGPMVAVALPVAAVLCPAASSLATLGLQPGRRSASGGDAQQRAVYIRGALTYWALASAALAIGTLPSAAALWAWVPLRRRLLLAACLHLQLLGSAPRLTRAGLLVVASAVRSMAPGQASSPPAGGVGSPGPAVGDEWRPRRVIDKVGEDGPAEIEEPRRWGGDAGADPDELRPVALDNADADDNAHAHAHAE